MYLKYDKPVILTLWDVSKHFDSECLPGVMNELYRNGVTGKLYRLLYHMNENTQIQAQTNEECNTGETLGQGTVEGAVASAVNLDNGTRDFFKESEVEV